MLVNKMDLVGYSADRFGEVAEEYRAYLRGLGVTPACIIPISAREGDNMVEHAAAMPWYQGPTVLQALDAFDYQELPTERPLRMPVQDVYKFDQRRIIAGRVESGTLRGRRRGGVLAVQQDRRDQDDRGLARARGAGARPRPGQSIGVTLTEQIFVERGEVMSHLQHAPIESNVFKARLFWLGHNAAADRQELHAEARHAGGAGHGRGDRARDRHLRPVDASVPRQIERNGAGEVVLRTKRMLALDEHLQNPITGRFVLVEDYLPLGGGIISMEGYPDQRAADHRALDQHHRGRPRA